MDNKAIAIVAVVAVAILAVAAFAVANPGSSKDEYVHYDGNGGVTSDGSKTFDTKETTAIALDKFVRDGYVLKSWNDKKDGSGTSYGPNANVMPGKTLYAQWEKEPSAGKLTVIVSNPYKDLFNFTLNGVNIDNASEYDIPVADAYYIGIKPAQGSSWVIGITDGVVTISVGGKDVSFKPAMVDGVLSDIAAPEIFSILIPFTFEAGQNPQLNFGFLE